MSDIFNVEYENKERIFLWDEEKIPFFDKNIPQKTPNITPYIVKGAKAAVVVCPGGGYSGKAYHEGEPIAWWLNSIGVSAFVLDYRVAPYKFPCPQLDAKRAIRYVRFNAEKYGYMPDRIGILGFSAGGHLAASCGTLFDDFGYEKQDEIDSVSARPDFMILCYPVISFVNCGHRGSCVNLLGEVGYAEAAKYSLERCVTEQTSPAFIWHTSSDPGVPVENSLIFAAELSKKHVPFEIHTFREGAHGLGLAETKQDIREWVNLCERWMRCAGYLCNCGCSECEEPC